MKYLDKINNTYVFFIFSIISAISHIFYPSIHIILSLIIIIFFLNKPINFIVATIFIAVTLTATHFFIVTEVTEYDKIYSIKTGSSRIHIDKSIKIEAGDLLVGNFSTKKQKMFFKPTLKADKIYGIYKIPIITNLLQTRKNLSEYLFYSSGGKVQMAQALIFGDRQFISNKAKDEYTISGLAHLLAMSGMHVAIISGIFMTSLFFIHIKFRILIAIPALFALIIFGAFSITVVRASLFATLLLICFFIDIKTVKEKFLLFMASFFILFSPSSIEDISFLLSFGAVSGIVFLMNNGYGYIKTALIMGIAATLITAPLSMYVFGTTNHLSILSTMIMSPIIYIHILFGILACIFPSLMINPLIAIERISEKLVSIIYDLSFFGFINKTIPLWLLVLCIIFIVITVLSKYKWLSFFSLLIIFYPSPTPPEMIFLNLNGSNKGFMIFKNDKKEVFYQGSIQGFRYNFLPAVAKYGITTFDYGKIKTFGGKNLYLKIKSEGTNFTDVCVNEINHNCSIIYHTRSNSIRKKDLVDNKLHIISKSKLKDDKILALSDKGTIIIDNNQVSLKNESNN